MSKISDDDKKKIIDELQSTKISYTKIYKDLFKNNIKGITYEDYVDFLTEYQIQNGAIIRLYNDISVEQKELIEEHLTNLNIMRMYKEGYKDREIVNYFNKEVGIENREVIKAKCLFVRTVFIKKIEKDNEVLLDNLINDEVKNKIITWVLNGYMDVEIIKNLQSKYSIDISVEKLEELEIRIFRSSLLDKNGTYLEILNIVYDLVKEGNTEEQIKFELGKKRISCKYISAEEYCKQAFEIRHECYFKNSYKRKKSKPKDICNLENTSKENNNMYIDNDNER